MKTSDELEILLSGLQGLLEADELFVKDPIFKNDLTEDAFKFVSAISDIFFASKPDPKDIPDIFRAGVRIIEKPIAATPDQVRGLIRHFTPVTV